MPQELVIEDSYGGCPLVGELHDLHAQKNCDKTHGAMSSDTHAEHTLCLYSIRSWNLTAVPIKEKQIDAARHQPSIATSHVAKSSSVFRGA